MPLSLYAKCCTIVNHASPSLVPTPVGRWSGDIQLILHALLKIC